MKTVLTHLPTAFPITRRGVMAAALAAAAGRPAAAVDSASDGQVEALHALNRLAFGPAPGDLERVARMGAPAWIAEQLQPERLALPAPLSAQLAALRTPGESQRELVAGYRELLRQAKAAKQVDTASADGRTPPTPEAAERRRVIAAISLEAGQERLLQALTSPRQLQEVLVDFWFNHFNVYQGKGLDRVLVESYEREAIRPHVLGRFRAMLGATAKHPAMLFYLDNWLSVAPGFEPRMRVGAAAKAAGLNENSVGRSAFAAGTASAGPALPRNKRLIVVFLRGAVDGLSVVVPHGDGAYYKARSSIALARPGQDGGVLDLDGYFGLNPNLAPLMPLWQSGRLAFVQASGSPDPTRSHFDAQDYMESGTPGRKDTPDGWLNRLLGAEPAAAPRPGAARGISVGATLPRIWAGPNPVVNIANGARATRPTLLDRPQVSRAFDALYAGDDTMSRAYRESQQSRAEVKQAMTPAAMDHEQTVADGGAPLPNGFPDDAARLARLMRRDADVQVAFVALGGWDTHVRQGGATGQLANRLQPLGQGLAELATRLGPAFDDTTILVISEFGRTVRQNGTGGTDHGHGNVMWALGGGVAGGKVYARWPGIDTASLHEGRDLAVTTDFRQVVAGVCARNLGLADSRLAAVFPGFDGAPLDLARA